MANLFVLDGIAPFNRHKKAHGYSKYTHISRHPQGLGNKQEFYSDYILTGDFTEQRKTAGTLVAAATLRETYKKE